MSDKFEKALNTVKESERPSSVEEVKNCMHALATIPKNNFVLVSLYSLEEDMFRVNRQMDEFVTKADAYDMIMYRTNDIGRDEYLSFRVGDSRENFTKLQNKTLEYCGVEVSDNNEVNAENVLKAIENNMQARIDDNFNNEGLLCASLMFEYKADEIDELIVETPTETQDAIYDICDDLAEELASTCFEYGAKKHDMDFEQ